MATYHRRVSYLQVIRETIEEKDGQFAVKMEVKCYL